MGVTLKSRGTLTGEQITELERGLGCVLPEGYREFLRTTNGGKPQDNVVKRGRHTFGVRSFFGVTGKASSDLLSHKETYAGRIPTTCIAIGDDGCGNLFCMLVSGPRRGGVYFWDHELECDEGETPTFANMTPLGDSFERFRESLEPFDPTSIRLDPSDVKSVWIKPGFLESLREQQKKTEPED